MMQTGVAFRVAFCGSCPPRRIGTFFIKKKSTEQIYAMMHQIPLYQPRLITEINIPNQAKISHLYGNFFFMANQPVYDTIGKGYNTTRCADPFITESIYKLLIPDMSDIEKEEKRKTGPYLDIGCGTGNYTLALSEKGIVFIGMDPSEKMLEEARTKSSSIKWVNATAEEIPAGDNTFAGAIATLTTHHWREQERAFKEIYRVLSPGARLVIFTSSPEQMEAYWLNHYFPGMLRTSIAKMQSPELVKQQTAKAGFRNFKTIPYFVQNDLQDLFLHSGKNKPEMYFDPVIRKGISSFAADSNVLEVEEGLLQLRRDIDSGVFEKIKNRYANDLGEYLFIALEK
jgi:ubiquinone/menaquinone biosynthesis C-methylase UbiE